MHNKLLQHSMFLALGRINYQSDMVRNCLLWALHFERDASVRIEACNAISKLNFQDDEIVKVLQDMIVVEQNETVKW